MLGEPTLTELVRRALAEADRWEVHALMRHVGYNPGSPAEVNLTARTLRFLRRCGELRCADPVKLSTVIEAGSP
ncbi:MAG: hypothetical protein KC503_17520 [Myxococcales bacterium]|nr:hypothetical protein [Myxococcales bacterium]